MKAKKGAIAPYVATPVQDKVKITYGDHSSLADGQRTNVDMMAESGGMP